MRSSTSLRACSDAGPLGNGVVADPDGLLQRDLGSGLGVLVLAEQTAELLFGSAQLIESSGGEVDDRLEQDALVDRFDLGVLVDDLVDQRDQPWVAGDIRLHREDEAQLGGLGLGLLVVEQLDLGPRDTLACLVELVVRCDNPIVCGCDLRIELDQPREEVVPFAFEILALRYSWRRENGDNHGRDQHERHQRDLRRLAARSRVPHLAEHLCRLASVH